MYRYPAEENTYNREQKYLHSEAQVINELDNRIINNEGAINNNAYILNELDNRIMSNEDALLALQKELRDLQKNNNAHNNLENIGTNLASIERIINELKGRIAKNEESYKENEDEINRKKEKISTLERRLTENENIIRKLQQELVASQNEDEINRKKEKVSTLERRLTENENTIRKLQQELVASQNRDLVIKESLESKDKKVNKDPKGNLDKNPLKQNKIATMKSFPKEDTTTHKSTKKITGIKTADFRVYPDVYSNNYNFKEKSNEFAFKQSNRYYIEIEPTKNLHRAKEIYKLISKHHIKTHFISPSLKHKEAFFRNLIEVDNINKMGSLYKNLESEFKDIKVIK